MDSVRSQREAPGAPQIMGEVLLMEQFLFDDIIEMYCSFVEVLFGG